MEVKNEPVALQGAVTGLVLAVLAVLVAFGVDLTQDQQVAILGLVAALIVVWSYFTRKKTYGPETVKRAGAPSPEDAGPPPVA